MFENLDNHAQLLLYLTGELPEANRERLERILAQDASLRNELEALRVSTDSIDRAIAALDVAQPMPEIQFAAATRQTARAIRQWQVDRAVRPAKPDRSPRRLQIGWRGYSVVAAAAVMLIGFTVWWQNSDHSGDIAERGEEPVAQIDNSKLDDQIEIAFDQSGMRPSERDGSIDQVEHEVDRLRDVTQISAPSNLDSETQ